MQQTFYAVVAFHYATFLSGKVQNCNLDAFVNLISIK